ncbi:MAG TPA: hypothetical protein VHX61_18930, partial [Rhizomicrobium sp.]|nr:hypothetical protein [Rhizomicrobium sp.]
LSQQVREEISTAEPITFYGPDVVDILANRVAIDGFSALSNGGNNLVCINTVAAGAGLQVKNTEISGAMNDDIHAESGCPNARFIGNIVTHAGSGSQGQTCGPGSPTCTGTGFYWSGDEMTLADGVIEESQGIGLFLNGAQKVSVSAMHIQGNGLGQNGGAGIAIEGNSSVISICGNHMEGNGGDIANSAQIYFSGTLDSINFCGNTYLPQQLADVAFRPLYVYDAASGTTLTNFHLYDAPAPQASGQVYSPNATLILPQLQVPHAPLGQISGVVLSNDTTTATQVDITPGEASDSTNSVTIELPNGCTDNLDNPANPGPGGLETGTTAAASTPYFYFAIASALGGNPNCIASTSTVPNLKHAGYPLTPTGETQDGVAYLYNLSSAAGLAPGQNIADNGYMSNGTTISTLPTAVGTLTNQEPANLVVEESGTSVTLLSGTTATIGTGMAVSDVFQFSGCTGTAQSKLAVNNGDWTVASVTSSTQFLIVPPPGVPAVSATNDCITVSGGNAVALSTAATGTTTSGPASFTIFGGLYRLIGALYTDSSANVVPFTQDGDTFYLDAPVADLDGVAVTSSAKNYTLNSVPDGIPVEAFGRCVAGEMVHIFNPSLAPGKPNSFPNAPGYDTDSLAPQTSFPYRSYTNSSGQIAAQAYTSGTMDCMTDGWMLHREGAPASGGSGLVAKAQRARAAREKLHGRKPV